MSSLVEGNTSFNIQDIETNSSILGPNNTNSLLLLTSKNEVLIVVESNTPFNI
jgi:hypothetical protein